MEVHAVPGHDAPCASPDGADRRRALRLNHGNLTAWIRQRGLFGAWRASRIVDWMDFNRFGMAFETDRRLRCGQRLLVSLKIEDARAYDITGVAATVRQVTRPHRGRIRCGVEFDFRAGPQMRSVETLTALAGIEKLLHDIMARLQDTPPAYS